MYMRLKSLVIGALISFIVAVGVLLGARDSLVHELIERRLTSLGADIGEPITLERVTLKALDQVTLHGLKVGEDRWVELKRVEVQMRWRDLVSRVLSGRRPHIQSVEISEPTLRMRGRDLEDALRRQQRRVNALMRRGRIKGRTRHHQRAAPQELNEQIASLERSVERLLRKLPPINIVGGRVVGAREALFLYQVKAKVNGGRISGSWWGETPRTGHCQIDGSAHSLKLYCNDDFHIPVDQVEIAGRQLEWTGGIDPSIELKGLHLKRLARGVSKPNMRSSRVEASQSGARAVLSQLPFSEVKLDLRAGLRPNPEGQHPLNVSLVFPGGGRVKAEGFASRSEAELTTQVSGFSMRSLAQGQGGTLNASARVWTRWREGKANLKGKLSLNQATINHPKLSKAEVGPFDLSAEGMMHVDWDPSAPKRLKVSLTGARAQLGAISGQLNLSWDQQGSAPHLKGDFQVPRLKASRFAESIPRGLMPHLQPLELGGRIGFRGSIDLDIANLKQTKLTWIPYLRGLKVISMNEAINFDQLSETLETRFEMPDGEVFTRVTGPKSERWVRLEDMPELLPIAVTSQEDGGFYKHRGISLFHLRGSLIRNLKEGRFVRGGSTLTMQLIKNLYLHRDKTLSRKLEEVCLAWLIERKRSKDELITLYLNIVEFGEDIFGIKEASQTYFEKEPIDLTPEEISALTRLLPGPRLYEPYFRRKRFSRAYANRVNRLLKLLQKRGHLDEEEWEPITRTSLWDRPVQRDGELQDSGPDVILQTSSNDDGEDIFHQKDIQGTQETISTSRKPKPERAEHKRAKRKRKRRNKRGQRRAYQPRPRELSEPF